MRRTLRVAPRSRGARRSGRGGLDGSVDHRRLRTRGRDDSARPVRPFHHVPTLQLIRRAVVFARCQRDRHRACPDGPRPQLNARARAPKTKGTPMTDVSTKVTAEHLRRDAYLYVRQSSLYQVANNTESTRRQYDLRGRAIALGWPADRVVVIDVDQGQSGASAADREGFQRLVADVSLNKAGIVLGLECSRLARNNADWHRLLQLCAFANTLICDEDGLYDPSTINDRLLLGLSVWRFGVSLT